MAQIIPGRAPVVTETTMGGTTPSQQAARARAIAKLTGASPAAAPAAAPTTGQAQQTPVLNPSAVSVEELGAITPAQASETNTQSAESTTPAAVQTNTVETTTAATDEQALSPQYAQLARKERAIRQQQIDLRVQQAELKAREAEIKTQANAEARKALEAEYRDKFIDRESLKKNPWEYLNRDGISYDRLTQEAMNQPPAEVIPLINEIRTLREELQTIKQEQQGVKTSFEQQQQQNYNQAVNQIRNEAVQLVSSDPAFETVAAHGKQAINDVVRLIETVYAKDGVLMTVEEAATEVENHLAERAFKLANLKKIQERMKAKSVPAPAAPTAAQQTTAENKQQPQAKTLTNGLTAAKPLSARDRAIAAFHGQKKVS